VWFLAIVLVVLAVAQPAGDDPLERRRSNAVPARWAAPTVLRYERPRLGLSVVVPVGWTVVRKPMSYCTDPVQRIALRGHGAVVQIVESLSGSVEGFPPRPGRFALRGDPQFLACCPPEEGEGWFIPFRDAGRGFYAYVYVGAPETRAHALLVLDSLRVGLIRQRAQPESG
jgi:hypothetical protein